MGVGWLRGGRLVSNLADFRHGPSLCFSLQLECQIREAFDLPMTFYDVRARGVHITYSSGVSTVRRRDS